MVKRFTALIILFVSVFSLEASLEAKTISEKYSHAILTKTYGLISDQDIEPDAGGGTIPPIGSKDSIFFIYWACFLRSQVQFGCYNLDTKEFGHSMFDADIHVETKDELHIYFYTRGQPKWVCDDHLKEWRRLSNGQPIVCLAGRHGDPESIIVKGKKKVRRQWVWDKLKTKLGCISFFEGEGC